jgi:hypothetical protein
MPTILTAREPANLSSLGVPPFYWVRPTFLRDALLMNHDERSPWVSFRPHSLKQGTNCIQSVEAGAHNESAGARCTATSCPTHFANPPNWAASFNRQAQHDTKNSETQTSHAHPVTIFVLTIIGCVSKDLD